MNIDLTESEQKLIDEFSKLNATDRMSRIMLLGDTGETKYFRLLQHSILHDPNANVKFAALKRIHLFKGHPDIIPFFTALTRTNNTDDLEPYFSMALSRLGIISPEEFERKINGG